MLVKIYSRNPSEILEIQKLEAKLKKPLMASFRKFTLEHGAAKIENNVYEKYKELGVNVESFIPISEIWGVRSQINEILEGCYPIARDGSGNFIVIGQNQDSEVLFWDHETNNFHFLAADFNAFMLGLKPFDIAAIDTTDMKVLKEWVDPNFLKSLSKK